MVMPEGNDQRCLLPRLTRCFVACLLLFGPATALFAAAPACLRCHSQHYATHGTCRSCHRGDERAIRKELAHHEFIPAALASYALAQSPARERGEKLADVLGCRRCHRLGGRGNSMARDLDQAAAAPPVTRLRSALTIPAWYMPDFRLAGPETIDLLTYLLATGEKAAKKPRRAETPELVHFVDPQKGQQNPFNRHCGGCHLTMTRREGGLGQGKVAPNLAGLLGEFYPRSYGRGEAWTRESLKSWLENPRASRPLATMLPVRLTPQEHAVLVVQLAEGGRE